MTAVQPSLPRAPFHTRVWADAKRSLQRASKYLSSSAPGRDAIQFSSYGVKLPRLGSGGKGAMISLDWDQFESLGPTIVRDLVQMCGLARQVSIVIAGADVLRKEIRLPSAVSSKLGTVVKFEAERQSPVSTSEIYFDHRTIGSDSLTEKLRVELRMIKRALLDRALRSCRLVGLEPVAVGIEGDETTFKPAGLVLNRIAIGLAVWRRWNIVVLSVLALLLLISGEIGFAHRQDRIAASISTQLNATRRQANSVVVLLKRLTEENDKIAFIEARRRRHLLINILAQLTSVLPSDAWIYEFQLNGNEGRIRGLASDAAKLLSVFEHSALFQGAQFRAPVTQGPKPGIERFDLSFKLKELPG